MKIMVVGSGGREHAIIKKLKESPQASEIYALPGNGGIAADAVCVNIGAKDIPAICDFAVFNDIDFAVVAPDDPLVMGAVDALTEKGIKCFGPTKAAAAIEGSKAFAKELMRKYDIPTAACEIFDDESAALSYISGLKDDKIVVKADGLALGKGVIIASNREEAAAAVTSMMSGRLFGDSGRRIVIEEFLTGPEVSVLAFTDGKTIAPLASSMDHKRAFDGDEGPNTGGMGAIAPNPFYTETVAEECMRKIFIPTIQAMNAEGRTFKGCLYFGLMLTKDGPKVIEYNCRFGDPETQAVLPLLEGDLYRIMSACADGRLAEVPFGIREGCSCCVVMASKGYPLEYETGFEIDIPKISGADIFCAGVRLTKENKLVTAGGRVLGVTACGAVLEDAVESAYNAVLRIGFANAYYRRDIGAAALKTTEEK